MIPRNGPKVELLPPLKLYKEDAEKLLALFTQNCQQVRIGDEEHVYDSLDEMATKAEPRLRCLSIAGVVPHAELVVRGSSSVPLGVQRSTLWIAERNEKSELLFLAARDLLEKRKWKPMIILRKGLFTFAAIIFIVCFFSKSYTGPGHVVKDLEYNFVVLFAIGLFIVGGLMHTKQVSYITLAARSKSESFWQRNGDKLVIAGVSILFGAMGTLIVEWLKRTLFTK